MKLSEAMREGAKYRPQTTGSLMNAQGSCALGAACEGLRIKIDEHCLRELYPALYASRVGKCPVDGCGKVSSFSVPMTIVHLNDSHKMSREAIAEWVETIELAQERASKPATERSETGTAPESSDVATTRQIESVLL